MIRESLLEDARRLIAVGADIEMIVLFLRDRGLDKIDSINSIRVLYQKPMHDAKIIVDESEAWSDRFHSDKHLHQKALDALYDLARSGDPDIPKITFGESPKDDRDVEE